MNIEKPRIVFCTTCKGRAYHLMNTLPQNMQDNRDYENCAFVVLDYADSHVLRESLRTYEASIQNGYLVVYHYFGDNKYREGPPPITFHMARAKNIAMRCGILEGADILVTLDADNFTGPSFASWIAKQFTEGNSFKKEIFLCPDFKSINAMLHGPERPPRGFAGRLAVSARDFIKMGGYDEIYDTWRGEDMDLMHRMLRAGYKTVHFENSSLNTIRHDASVRFKEYPHAKQYEDAYEDEMKAVVGRTETVVNNGNFGVGNLFKNFARSYVSLKPIPTRIFGIGLHRTATTSLHKAFEVLGFDSWHFRNGNDARLIWEQMNTEGTSKLLEQWYALCDLPIPMLYRKLDESYPGSKFILTVRDEMKWIESVRRLWAYEHNPQRWTWDIYPISHKLHKALYGRIDFDAETFLNRYRRHNAEVKEYFKDRQNDLLIMNIESGSGWPELCHFLGTETPLVPFPYETHTTKQRIESHVS